MAKLKRAAFAQPMLLFSLQDIFLASFPNMNASTFGLFLFLIPKRTCERFMPAPAFGVFTDTRHFGSPYAKLVQSPR